MRQMSLSQWPYRPRRAKQDNAYLVSGAGASWCLIAADAAGLNVSKERSLIRDRAMVTGDPAHASPHVVGRGNQ
jgi:hypothetical protein